MNSGWRYQFLVIDCARHSERFRSLSDIGAAEGDFNATIDFRERQRKPLSLYVSVKNRSNTMGGQDWPKAIQALENVAKTDKNRTGPYCCVFGIAMDDGGSEKEREHLGVYFNSIEVWFPNYYWPFFTNYSYEEIMMLVLDVLLASGHAEELSSLLRVPDKLLDFFGDCCMEAQLVDDEGNFNDPYKLIRFFCC